MLLSILRKFNIANFQNQDKFSQKLPPQNAAPTTNIALVDTVDIYAPNCSIMPVVRSQAFTILRKPHRRLLILGYREQQVSFSVVADLGDGTFVAVQHQWTLQKKANAPRLTSFLLHSGQILAGRPYYTRTC